ncbi:actin-like ATPase domain-containing protein [Patellaria atrata CBS 101060]|uniref:Actin-like ATPase domain-containing protein n=1 Tax=Patellaria atrata CBS 101060 TaxID=1346257 RepID=A0A9P4SI50_9PEZI|nr:actin-like ATPase domain-containing protein [Patellaria atrata CBS 101060]
MPPFKEEQIIIIAPGSQTTLAQYGLPESLTPARVRVRSRLFPAEKEGEWEPFKVRRKETKQILQEEKDELREMQKSLGEKEEDVTYEEDFVTEEGAVWPIVEGKIMDWSCFFALMTHVFNALNPPFHTPILLVAQPCWTPKEQEKITQFFFEKFKMPAFTLMDSAKATSWAFGKENALVVDVGYGKADVTAITEFCVHQTGRMVSLTDCGGEAMTRRLHEVLKSKGFTRDMAEQLKRNPICEILPQGTPLPGSGMGDGAPDTVMNPAAVASTGAIAEVESGAAIGNVPRGPGLGTEVGEEQPMEDDNEGVLDVASIVAGGKMNEYLARKEKEKQDRIVAKKKGATDASAAAAKPVKLPNSKREHATFVYEDHALLDALKNNLSIEDSAKARAVLDEGPQKRQAGAESEPASAIETNGTAGWGTARNGTIRREITVGTERFQAASGGILEYLADAIHRTISAVEDTGKRGALWENLIVVGNGSAIRGFKEALMSVLQGKYLISPSSATIFTSEIPSGISTPTGTGTSTPQPQLGPHGGGGSSVNPLLLAATTAQLPHSSPGNPVPNALNQHSHTSHGQAPTTIRFSKFPEYFPEWKDSGTEEAVFLGAQVAAKVVFIADQGLNKGYMTRPDYNEQGPPGIHYFAM